MNPYDLAVSKGDFAAWIKGDPNIDTLVRVDFSRATKVTPLETAILYGFVIQGMTIRDAVRAKGGTLLNVSKQVDPKGSFESWTWYDPVSRYKARCVSARVENGIVVKVHDWTSWRSF